MKRIFAKRFRQLVGAGMVAALIFSNLPPVCFQTGIAADGDIISPVKPAPTDEDAAKYYEGYYNGDTDAVTLLAGNSESLRGSTLAETISNYDKTFLLGVAADFCVFMNESFEILESDAEGRVAVGGDFLIHNAWQSYAVGAGDYQDNAPLDILLGDRAGAATIILGGINDGVLRDGQLSDVYHEWNGSNYEVYEGDTSHKASRILTLNYPDGSQPADAFNTFVKNGESLENIPDYSYGSYPKVDKTQTYITKLFDFNTEYNKLYTNSANLSKIVNPNTEIIYEGDTLTFRYIGEPDERVECVYFTLEGENIANFQKAQNIKFEGIPLLPETYGENGRPVVNNDGTPGNWKYSYIVVNVAGKGSDTLFSTDDAYNHISNPLQYNEYGGDFVSQNPQFPDPVGEPGIDTVFNFVDIDPYNPTAANRNKSTKITGVDNETILLDPTRNDNKTQNNHPGVTSLLYNFYEADEHTAIVLGSNFQGTILAPYAYVTDEATLRGDGMHGHLSGALIARKFRGMTEFGYRPFTGGVKLAPSSMDYRIGLTKYEGVESDYDDVDLHDPELEDSKKPPLLSGATFGIFEAKSHLEGENLVLDYDEEGKPQFSNTPAHTVTTSEETEQDFIALNSGYYVLKEISAPAGYTISDKEYYIVVEDYNYRVKIDLNKKTVYEVWHIIDEEAEEDEDKEELIYEAKNFTPSYNVTEVVMPRTKITVCRDDRFDMTNNPQEGKGYLAQYTYSSFRANDRRYLIDDHEMKFHIYDSEGSLIQKAIGEISIDGGDYEQYIKGHDYWKNADPDIELVHVPGLDSKDTHDGNPEEPFMAYVVLYKGSPVFPIVTLNRVIEEDEDNEFDGFVFFDEKAITVKKVDESTGRALKGAIIDVFNEGYTYDSGTYTKYKADMLGKDKWEWDSSQSALGLSSVELLKSTEDGFENIYRITETGSPTGYDLADKDTIVIKVKIGAHEYLYMKDVDRGEDITELPVKYNGSEFSEVYPRPTGWKSIMMGDAHYDTSENRTVVVKDKKAEGANFQLRKVDALTNELLSGAVISLYHYDPETDTSEFIYSWDDFDGYCDFKSLDVDSDYVNDEGISPGVYYLVEETAPAGHKIDLLGERLYFTVNGKGDDYRIDPGYKVYDNPTYYFDGNPSNGWVEYYLKIGDLVLNNSSTAAPTINNVKRIEIHFDDNSTATVVNGIGINGNLLSEYQWKNNVPINDNTITITGYDKFEGVTTFKVQGDGLGTTAPYVIFYTGNVKTDEHGKELGVDGNPALDISGNTLSIRNEAFDYQVGVSKVDKENENKFLPGAEITLFRIDEENGGLETPVETITKNSVDGVLIFDKLKPGKYVIRETEAPDGYTLNSNTEYYFEITEEDIREKILEKEEKTPKKYSLKKGEITEDAASDTTKYAPASEPKSDGTKYIFADYNWTNDSSVKCIETISWTRNNSYDKKESLVQSLEFSYDEGGSCTVEYTAWQDWGDWTLDKGYFVSNKGKDNLKIKEVRAELKETITNSFNITIKFKDGIPAETYTIDPSKDKSPVTILGGSTLSEEYYRIVDPAKEPDTPTMEWPDINGVKHTVEAVVKNIYKTFSTSKVTLKVYKDNTFTTLDAETVVYDPLNVSSNTYTIDGEEYTITVSGEDITSIKQGGTEVTDDDLKAKLKAVAVSGGHIIFYDDEVLYPTFVTNGNFIITDVFTNAATVGGGLKITDEESVIKINKKDEDGGDLSGAKLKLTLDGASKNKDATLADVEVSGVTPEEPRESMSITWISNGESATFTGLPDGTYIITEEEAPEGYKTIGSIIFVVDNGVIVYIERDGVADNIVASGVDFIDVVNEPDGEEDERPEIEISKKDKDNTAAGELSGAKFKLAFTPFDDSDDTLEEVTVSGVTGTKAADNMSITWTSGTSPAKFTGLPDGKYTITEEDAPEGYKQLTEPIEFEIIEGKLYIDNTAVDNSLVEIFNEKDDTKVDVELPSTGGRGVFWFCMIGMLLIGLSAIALFEKRRSYHHKN